MDSKSYTASDIFSCKQCGDCCEGYGGTYVTKKDIQNISEYIGQNPDSFIEKYCDISGGRPVLTRGKDGKCVFFDKLCTIHPVKPRMCRAWPFIKNVLADIKNWDIMSSVCPGIRTDIPDEIITEIVKKELLKLDGNK